MPGPGKPLGSPTAGTPWGGVLAAGVLVAVVALAGCLGAGTPGDDASPAANGAPDEGGNRTGNGTDEGAPSRNRSSPGNETSPGDGTASAGNATGNETRNATATRRYEGPGYPAPEPARGGGCEAPLGGACFPLNGTELALTVEAVEDEAAGDLPAAYVLFWDANGTVRDAGEEDGWFCVPSPALEVPTWAAAASVHTGDPASGTTQGGCGPAPPPTRGSLTVRFLWRPI